MTTETAQSETTTPATAPLMPAEASGVALPAVEERPVTNSAPPSEQAMVQALQTTQIAAPGPVEPTGIAGWFVRNRWFTKEPVTYLGFQFGRAAIATVPYGFGMAAGHHAFGMMSVKGQKMGLTEDGIKAFTNGVVSGDESKSVVKGLAGVEKLLANEVAIATKAMTKPGMVLTAAEKTAAEVLGTAKVYQAGLGGSTGRGIMRMANSPLNPAVQIALGFTLFRFTGSIIKNVRDRIMNEKNTPEQTIAEVKHAPKTVLETMKINWQAESTGTPIAALVLGFMNAAFVPTIQPIRDKSKTFLKQVGELWSPKAKLLQNAAVWTASYSLFFLMAESLFRDKQMQRGYWKGHPNSLKNGPDDTVGGPGAVSYTPPGGVAVVSAADAFKKQDEDMAQDSREQLRFPGLTGEPSLGRFAIRRVLPVAVGISAYAALKRVGYIASPTLPGMKANYLADSLAAAEKGEALVKTAWNGPMEPISVKVADALAVEGSKLKTAGNHAKFFAKNAYREGKATIMFGALWAATDAWGTFYDKFVHNLQKPENAVPLNEHQQDKHAELLARINEKDKSQGRAA